MKFFFSTAMVFSIFSAIPSWAQDSSSAKVEYSYKIKAPLLSKIAETCVHMGKSRSSVIKVIGLEDAKAEASDFVDFSVRMSVCPLVGELRRIGLSIPIPKLLIQNVDEAVRRKTLAIRVSKRKLFRNDESPNAVMLDEVVATLTRFSATAAEFSIQIRNEGKSIEKVKQIKLVFVNTPLKDSVRGFKDKESISLKSIALEFAEPYLVLESELYKISEVVE
jgi:hypothetical protein